MSSSEKNSFKIALDAMGGNFAPDNEIQGAILASKDYAVSGYHTEIIFIGDEKRIVNTMSRFEHSSLSYTIVHADEVITMDDEATSAIKKKKNSSMYKGFELHASGDVDAFISAGNTGAMLSTATVLLGRIEGVSRPTIGSFFPTENRTPALLLDVGANIDCKPKFLYEFAVMGSIYAKEILGIESPKVGLLNIGEEAGKGTEVQLEAYKILSASNLNFIGNVEGQDILNGSADVIVCDGFTGNVVLKFAESVFSLIKSKVKRFADSSIFNRLYVTALVPMLRKLFDEFNYEKYGGVPILGVKGNAIVGHGKSSPDAIKNMIFRAMDLVRSDLANKIKTALNT